MKKRVIDIYPPRVGNLVDQDQELPVEVEKTASANVQQRRPKTAVFALLAVCALAVPLVFVHFFFARASIQVWPQVTKLRVEEYIIAQAGYDTVNLEKKIVRAHLFEEEVGQTLLLPSTGKKFKETKARGTIRVYNENSTEPQDLVASTRFISEDGKIFRLEKAVSIPGGKMDGRKLVPGSLDVQVEAAEPGPEYNIGASNFSLPGLVGSEAYTKIFGESLRAMAGGASHQVSVVTEEDISRAEDELIATLKIKAMESLLAKVPPEFQILQDSFTSAIVEDTSLVKPGVELDEFNYTGKVKVSMIGFYKEDADLLVRSFLRDYAGAEQDINEETLHVVYKASREDAERGVIPIEVQVEADVYTRVESAAIKKLVQGTSDSQFQQVMKEYPFLAKAQFSLWPFWASRIPKDDGRISFEVLLEG